MDRQYWIFLAGMATAAVFWGWFFWDEIRGTK